MASPTNPPGPAKWFEAITPNFAGILQRPPPVVRPQLNNGNISAPGSPRATAPGILQRPPPVVRPQLNNGNISAPGSPVFNEMVTNSAFGGIFHHSAHPTQWDHGVNPTFDEKATNYAFGGIFHHSAHPTQWNPGVQLVFDERATNSAFGGIFHHSAHPTQWNHGFQLPPAVDEKSVDFATRVAF
eukprot:NODE_5823_length_905_cov_74.851662_g5597_i0.p1 GENE.NODE_5823_length_905_cov_74.851662_g5597_i0~~NODE_5823_length_905_cov_74.851662_g5597_i0.p1  ORF type:complete len:185 (+),score=39.82 NODE_5823_length_905_cov_74.851662_g5597_i0:63-617(+)